MSLNVSGYDISDIYVGDDKIDSIFVGEDLVYSSGPKFYDYFGFQADDPTQVSMITLDNTMTEGADKTKFYNYADPVLYYSYDRQTWNSYTLNTAISIGGNNPPTVYMKGDNLKRWYQSYVDGTFYIVTTMFSMSGGTVSAIGNIMALRYSNPTPNDIIPCDYAFRMLFANCTLLTTAPELPATTLTDDCYSQMFYGCTSLTTAPELPATTLAYYCYQHMFAGCTSLTTAPELPATTLADYCYQYMFDGCTSLTTAPELPATTLTSSCYAYMFDNCTSLQYAPELPATTLTDHCYQYMFDGCTSLTTAPELPATTLADYCYSQMFYGCTSLTTAPELPATTLTSSCYSSMFAGCTSLAALPKLPATTLADYCYQYMFWSSAFNGGIKANDSSSSPCIYPYRIPSVGSCTGGTKSLNDMFGSLQSASIGYTPSINTTFYTAIPMAT